MEKVDRSRQVVGGLAELCSTSNFPFSPFGNLNFPQTKEMKPDTSTNLQGFLDYSINCNFEMPRNVYNDNLCNPWNPEPGPCPLPLIYGNSYSQVNKNKKYIMIYE